MKTVKFNNKIYTIPDKYKFITQDEDGVYVWVNKPTYYLHFKGYMGDLGDNEWEECVSEEALTMPTLMEIE